MSRPAHKSFDIFRVYTAEDIYGRLSRTLGKTVYKLPADPGAKIVLKPNCNANMNALTGNTTDLRVVCSVIRLLKEHGYTDITLAEGTNSGFYRNRIGVMQRLKLDAAADYYGIKLKDLNYDKGVAVCFKDGVMALVSETCLEADCFINLPKLKTHFETGMSVCLKNLMGCLVGQENKKKTHLDLAANILLLNSALAPHLHIVDSLIAMEGLGPTRGTPKMTDLLLVGNDPYLLDLVSAKVAGFDWKSLPVLVRAYDNGLITDKDIGTTAWSDLENLVTSFEPPRAGPLAGFIHHPKRQKYFLAVRNTPLFNYLASTQWFGALLFMTGLRQDVFCDKEMDIERIVFDGDKCAACGLCEMICPLGKDPRSVFTPGTPASCLNCLYCCLVCPQRAFDISGELGFLKEQIKQYDRHLRLFSNRYNSSDNRLEPVDLVSWSNG